MDPRRCYVVCIWGWWWESTVFPPGELLKAPRAHAYMHLVHVPENCAQHRTQFSLGSRNFLSFEKGN